MVVSICRNGGAAALRSVSIFRTTGFRIAGQAVSPHRNIQANGLNTFAYLEQLLMHMVDWDHTPEFLDEMMPWSNFMQETCGK